MKSIKNQADGQQKSLWVAAVSWYMPHECLVWFGKHTQVWASITVPALYKVTRFVYTGSFGRGLDTVNVVVPLRFFVAPHYELISLA